MNIRILTAIIMLLSIASCGEKISGYELSETGFYKSPKYIIKNIPTKTTDFHKNYMLAKAYADKKEYKKSILYYANSCFKSKNNFKLRLFPHPVYAFVDGFHFKSPYYDDAVYNIAKLFYKYGEHKYVIKFIDLMDSNNSALYRDGVILKSRSLGRLKNHNEAIEILNTISKRFQDKGSSANIQIRLASIYENQRLFEQALDAYFDIIKHKNSGLWQTSLAMKRIQNILPKSKSKLTEERIYLLAKTLSNEKKYIESQTLLTRINHNKNYPKYDILEIRNLTNTNIRSSVNFIKEKKDLPYIDKLKIEHGNALWKKRQKFNAIKTYKALTNSTDKTISSRVLRRLSYYYEERNNPEFIKYMNSYISKFPNNDLSAKFNWLIGRYYIRNSSYKNSLFYLNRTIKKYPKSRFSANCLYWKLRIFKKQNRLNKENRIKMLEEMNYNNPSSPYTLRELARLSDKLKIDKITEAFTANKDLDNEKGMLLYQSILFIKSGYTKDLQDNTKKFSSKYISLFSKLSSIMKNMDYKSDLKDELQSMEKYFIVGDDNSIRREISTLDLSNPDIKHDLSLTLCSLGNKYHNFYYSSFHGFRLLSIYKAKEYLPFLKKLDAEILYPKAFNKCIEKESKIYGLNKSVLLSMIKAESYFKPNAISPVGARGLMQLMPPTAKGIAKNLKLKKYNLLDPCISVKFGADYIKWLSKYYKNKIEYMVAGYNAGAGNVNKWKKRYVDRDIDYFTEFTPFNETRYYIYSTQKFKIQYDSISKNNAIAK